MQGIEFKAPAASNEMYAVDRDIDPAGLGVPWPNRQYGKQVPAAARAGEHRITGDGIPRRCSSRCSKAADFMPKLALRTQGEMTDAIGLFRLVAVMRARGPHHRRRCGCSAKRVGDLEQRRVPGAREDLHAISPAASSRRLKQKSRAAARHRHQLHHPEGHLPRAREGGRPAGDDARHDDRVWPELDHLSAEARRSEATLDPGMERALARPFQRLGDPGLDFGGMQQMEEDGEDGQQQKKPGMKGIAQGHPGRLTDAGLCRPPARGGRRSIPGAPHALPATRPALHRTPAAALP